MISVEEMKYMPKSQLISIYKVLNVWGWHELMGDKPVGWDEMPNYKKPYMDECVTKADVIRPYMRAINKIIPHSKMYSESGIFEGLMF